MKIIHARLVRAGTTFKNAGRSPLNYKRAGGVQRIVLIDTSVTDPPAKNDRYFAHIENWRRVSKRGKKLKNPVLDSVIPGVGDNSIVGFIDFHDMHKDYYYIDYVKTRGDLRGKGYARQLIEHFYKKRNKKGTTIHWGKMMQPQIGHLFEVMVKKFSDVKSIGSKNY